MTSSTATSWWRLIRFVAREDGQTYFGQPLDDTLDVGVAYANASPLIKANVLYAHPLSGPAPLSGVIKTVSTLLPPLLPSEVPTIRALGANFVQPGQNAFDAIKKRPTIPILFYKPLSTLSGPGRDIVLPKCAEGESDYEVELVVVLGQTIKDATPEECMKAILGYTLSNDVSARVRMFAVPQWGLGKSFDGWLPIGPCLVSASNARGIQNPDSVHLTTKLNNRVMQDGNTSEMLWKTAETLAELSKGTTLEQGSLVSMGTPPGEGFKRNPKVWLKDGDTVQLWGSGGLGSLINGVRNEGKGDKVPVFKAKL
ncbi:Fumarylacetoacetase, C-terminal [Kalmanozyma brasiliensis GHG001]|uniref:Fumarylacetoacetate hydrolase n=1 Tax=Kalmanozyma brasiliensis (strain GHG001) TaxID=1365824 RepID=V5EV47_KALBG|nr:Fumarylacetoacetase, C-terminal [Kalmanozyma brasiliensis GHG001]EST07073.1 Fumarylacetoacetase, C-terminal [Kalmanozyma brasiliensis GHG001]